MIKIDSLTYKYNDIKTDSPALDNINLEINEGEYICVLGNNGSRKNYFSYAFKWAFNTKIRRCVHRQC